MRPAAGSRSGGTGVTDGGMAGPAVFDAMLELHRATLAIEIAVWFLATFVWGRS